ncbi:enoyl-CoA hydratase/isomerase family protein [Nocardioides sp. KC13]|uniref:Enoyl-CoA hydratase/isomerase family protein n=1 Tax=Nocardioides turkmenicus TaxID=2711220 RepID=A0A6M1R2V0_9ACTN|nr:enoyl-CoA hydratase-related protein [Nocardioides sp. KC13]NGN94260.1 enoyl-CoA hydratase/isomerase family protein [Nocardioides sp. KC13]
MSDLLLSEDRDRVRTLTLNRPEQLNAFNQALYVALAEALRAADEDPEVAVVLLTGTGRAFSAGTDLVEMKETASGVGGATEDGASHGFVGLLDSLVAFSKPLVVAVNGLGLGIGATLLGYADLVLASTAARFKTPFTTLGVAPEAASSFLFPRLIGRQNAAWMLLSGEWIGAEEAHEMGLVWRVTEPDDLLAAAWAHAATLATRPISSLVAVKETMTASLRPGIEAARELENAKFAELLGGPANMEALVAFAEGREPDFTRLPPGV